MCQLHLLRFGRVGVSAVLSLVLSLSSQGSTASVEEHDIIDMVSNNRERTEVFLGIVQQLQWNERTFELLRRKVATYEAFIRRGELQRRHPHTEGMAASIEVAYSEEPDAAALAELKQLQSSLATRAIKLRWFKLKAAK